LEIFFENLDKKFICLKAFFCHFSSYLFAVLLQQKQVQEEFMLILGGFQGFQGPWGVLTSFFEVVLSPQELGVVVSFLCVKLCML
jgi:ABC-type enterochelin transport system permease subunit